MQILVTGPTGLVGGEVIREAIADSKVDRIVAISRRPLEIEHPKLTVRLHENFLDFSAIASDFQRSDACIWCLGISQNKVRGEEYERITYGYTLAASQTMLGVNPDIRMIFLSGKGADRSMQSRVLFAHIKGKTEVALTQLPFRELFIARPAGIQPVRPNPNASRQERSFYPFYPFLKLLAPSLVITSTELARAMIHVAKGANAPSLLFTQDLRKLLSTS